MKVFLQYFAISATIIFSTLFSVTLQAQDEDDPLAPKLARTPIYIGPTVGLNRALHSVDLSPAAKLPGGTAAGCEPFTNGSAMGFWVGGTFEYQLGDAVNSKSSIITRLLYQTMPASMEVINSDNYPSIVTNSDGSTREVFSYTRFNNEVVYSLLSLDIQYKLNLFESNFGITVGPTIDIGMTKTQDVTMNLVEPLEAQFKPDQDLINQGLIYENNNRTIVLERGDIPQSSAIRFGIKAGVQYEILMEGYYIVPSFNYNFGVTNLTSENDWRVSALQFGVDIRFAL